MMKKLLVTALVTFIGASAAYAEDHPNQVYWGDTHNHTGNSFDVFLFGTTSSTPDTAYRFAKGLPVINPATGTRWQINTPLDFLVVADHAEMLGAMPKLFAGDKTLTETKTGKAFVKIGGDQSHEKLQKIYDIINYANSGAENEAGLNRMDLYNDLHGGDKRKGAWERNIESAEVHNEPGKFTALIGWEWTSTTGGKNLHRILFMKQDGSVAKKFIPYSTLESDDPEDLWKWLDITSKKLGADFIAIPHNSNISVGRMFPLIRNNGKPVDKEYAQLRMRWEPLIEATQIKGDSEAHPNLSPTDEFSDYETYDFALTPDGDRPAPTEADYVRSGLKRGLKLETTIGVNPYKIGMIGATDTHTGIAAIEENNFAGKGQHDATPELRTHPTGLGSSMGWDMGAAGYAGVWATENTREALFDAFKRKEVYTTTGPRITLRFFGGFDFSKSDISKENIANVGYSKGVPMGGDLKHSSKSPSFLTSVLKDPKGANLDRVQIIKGWLDKQGELHERIYDVAVSGERTIGKDGRSKEPVGNTVNLNTGEYTNSIGEPQLNAYWSDPDFDASEHAFYYVRGLEIPTPRYSLLDAIALGIDWKETKRPATIQERVYSSPIWYTPK
jgi:hypothetical protein